MRFNNGRFTAARQTEKAEMLSPCCLFGSTLKSLIKSKGTRIFPSLVLPRSTMASQSIPVYISRLQVIPPAMLLLVPLATVVLFFVAVSRTVVQHRHEPVLIHVQLLDRRRRRVAWVFPVVFSLALLAIVVGALVYFRGKELEGGAFTVAVAECIVTSVLYVELSVSALYLLNVVADLRSIQPVIFYCYSMVLAAILFSATFLSVMGLFMAAPPLLAPILYLSMAILTMPVITFSFLSTLSVSEAASLAPQITLSSTYSYPAFSSDSEKRQMMLDDVDVPSPTLEMSAYSSYFASRRIPVYILCGQISAVIHFAFAIGLLVLLPDQSSLPSTLTSEEVAAGLWVEALVFRIIQTVFLVAWIICTMSAFLRTTVFEGEPPCAASLDEDVDADDGVRRHRVHGPPAPRAPPPVQVALVVVLFPASAKAPHCTAPREPGGLPEPARSVCVYALQPHGRAAALPRGDAAFGYGERPTRMSAWGTLPLSPGPPPVIPPRPPPNVLVFNPPSKRLPSLRDLAARVSAVPSAADSGVYVGSVTDGNGNKNLSTKRSMSFFSYTTPSAYSQEGETADEYDGAFDVEEARLAQMLLRRLDAAGTGGGGWKLKRNGSTASRRRS
ncbi:hypothetical protein MSAN_00053500 [Mycena sanguinolenta]|uniref:Uncharacterized protein n=1 Tax=Mycena sanguinolenta TaxID=230812 RepID=A0A8H6ZC80_9AGAR|nr:hypothetical protein MSAN_00053500 [Mycena sanguinolenta]